MALYCIKHTVFDKKTMYVESRSTNFKMQGIVG